jgi:sulfite exporter TauE/SafE
VILLGLDLLGVSPWRNSLGFAPIAWLRRQFRRRDARGVLPGAIIGGAINGLMPCSMTMAMAVKATTAPSVARRRPADAGLRRRHPALDALGELPLRPARRQRTRGWLLKGAALFVIVLGLRPSGRVSATTS